MRTRKQMALALVVAWGLAGCTARDEAADEAAARAKDLAHETSCTSCHDMQRRLLGPSFHEVAERYAAHPDAAAILTESLRAGSNGKWGTSIGMPAQRQLDAREVRLLTRWILQLAREEPPSSHAHERAGAPPPVR